MPAPAPSPRRRRAVGPPGARPATEVDLPDLTDGPGSRVEEADDDARLLADRPPHHDRGV